MIKNAKIKKMAAAFLAAAMVLPMAVTGFAAGYSVDFAGQRTEVENTATTAKAEFKLSISDNLYGFATATFELEYDKNILALKDSNYHSAVSVISGDSNESLYEVHGTPIRDTVYYMVYNRQFKDDIKRDCATIMAEFDIVDMNALEALGHNGTEVRLKFYENDVNCTINAQEDLVYYVDGELDVTDTPATISVAGTEPPVPVYLIGDVNADGVVNAKDKTILNRYLAGWEGYDAMILNWDAADINRDGNVNGRDKTILNRYLAGWEGYDEYFN